MANDMYKKLKEDHQVQRRLMEILEKTHGDSDGRRELFDRFCDAVEAHAAAEERVLYAELLQKPRGRDHAAHSVKEHEEMREMLEQLRETDMSSSGWLATARKLFEMNRHHMDEEEQKVFSVAGQIFESADESRMQKAYTSIEGELRG